MDQIRDHLSRILSRPKGTKLHIERDGFSASPFSPEHFHPFKAAPCDLTFVDGGQAILFETPELLVGIVRTAAVRQQGTGTTVISKEDHYVLINTAVRGTLRYEISLIGPQPQQLSLDPNEASIREGISRAALSKALEIVRRLKEIELAAQCPGIVVLDGELDAKTPIEQAALKNLLSTKSAIGVVKGAQMVTDQGTSLNGALLSLSPGGAWQYYPLASSPSVEWVLAKLSKDAEQPLRIDIPVGMGKEPLMGMLYSSAQDLSFPGYPYGLLVADQFARVSAPEAGQRKAMLMADLAADVKTQGFDAHDVLNRVVLRMSKNF